MHLNPTNHLGTYLDKYCVVPYFFRSWFLTVVGLLIKYINQDLSKREFVKCCLDWCADCSRTPSRWYRLINKTLNSRLADLPTGLLIIYLIELPKFHMYSKFIGRNVLFSGYFWTKSYFKANNSLKASACLVFTALYQWLRGLNPGRSFGVSNSFSIATLG